MINMTNVEYIDYFEKIIANEPENILSLYFVQKLMSDVRFRSFQPMISAELQKKILKMVLPKLKNQFKINRLVDFNPIGVADEEIEILNKESVTDPLTGEMKKKQMKFFPDAYKNRIGKSYNDYIADHQMNMFEDFIGYQSSTVLDEPEREAGTTSIPIPQREESENIPLPDLPGQLENVQQSGNEIAERGMPT